MVAFLFAVDFDKFFKPLLPVSHLSIVAQVALFIFIEDFAYYWWHRAQHHFRFLWVFHAVHHSQERLTFATNGRFHPIERLMFEPVIIILMMILGFNVATPLIVAVFFILLSEFQHTQIPWRYGPFYRIFVSPVYHSYHHGKTAEYKDKNFAHIFAFWDYLFGTAVARNTPPPSSYGLVEMNPQSFVETLTAPFRLLYEDARTSWFRPGVPK